MYSIYSICMPQFQNSEFQYFISVGPCLMVQSGWAIYCSNYSLLAAPIPKLRLLKYDYARWDIENCHLSITSRCNCYTSSAISAYYLVFHHECQTNWDGCRGKYSYPSSSSHQVRCDLLYELMHDRKWWLLATRCARRNWSSKTTCQLLRMPGRWHAHPRHSRAEQKADLRPDIMGI